MRALHLTDCFYPQIGGYQVLTYQLTSKIAQLGTHCDVITLKVDPADKWVKRGSYFNVSRPFVLTKLPCMGSSTLKGIVADLEYGTPLPRMVFSLDSLVKNGSVPDVLHVHGGITSMPIVTMLLRKFRKLQFPLVSSLYNLRFAGFSKAVETRFLKAYKPDVFIVSDDSIRDILVNDFRFPEERIETVPVGVDTAFLLPAPRGDASPDGPAVSSFLVERARLRSERRSVSALSPPRGLGPLNKDRLYRFLVNVLGRYDKPSQQAILDQLAGKKVIFVAAVLLKYKGIDLLVDAVAKLKDRSVLLIIAGDGPELQPLKALAAKLGIQGRVLFLGKLPWRYVKFALDLSHAFVLPNRPHEGSQVLPPLALLEAMSMEVPCIVTDIPGISDAVRSSGAGFVVPCEDSSAIASALASLFSDEAKRLRTGKKGRAYVEKRHSLETNARHVIAVYEKLLSGGYPK